ncbi:hypothetical protein Vi05172_g3624 [Venturia inaequalis]|nr:hypothetical protein Vi05172_g3624 [Venturia inaequalis]
MKKLYMLFSKGTYKCVGQTSATVSLRIVVATLIFKYAFKLAKDATLLDMDWDDHFIIIPRKGCLLVVAPVVED